MGTCEAADDSIEPSQPSKYQGLAVNQIYRVGGWLPAFELVRSPFRGSP